MASKDHFTVSEFAELARTTRAILHHHDKIGLLSPVSRGANRYRYYSSGQLAVVNLIHTFQELGMTLAEIKAMKDRRTPENVYELLSKQIEVIDSKVDEWRRAQELLLTLQKSIHSALCVDEECVSMLPLPSEPIILGSQNDYSNGRGSYDTLLSFYRDIHEKYSGLYLNYPVWAVRSMERIRQGEWARPDRYYMFAPDGRDKRPTASYVIGYTRGGYGHGGGLFGRMCGFIEKNGLEICGDAYEEYPLNEICVRDNSAYLIKIMIPVRKKEIPAHVRERTVSKTLNAASSETG